jgi:hypothetical protein
MSTRGVIARATQNGFRGVYHHWDSYPEGLGKTLWDLWHDRFNRDTKAMLETLIDQHPAGWSTIVDADFSLPIGYVKFDFSSDQLPRNPQCYCHGDRHEPPVKVTQRNASGMGCEYAYVFNEKTDTMTILSSFCDDGKKMIGLFGCGDPKAIWKPIAIIDLNEPNEPDWKQITRKAKSAYTVS